MPRAKEVKTITSVTVNDEVLDNLTPDMDIESKDNLNEDIPQSELVKENSNRQFRITLVHLPAHYNGLGDYDQERIEGKRKQLFSELGDWKEVDKAINAIMNSKNIRNTASLRKRIHFSHRGQKHYIKDARVAMEYYRVITARHKYQDVSKGKNRARWVHSTPEYDTYAFEVKLVDTKRKVERVVDNRR
ncbi:hypothetical protein M0R01_03740 [bacterium]|nr:hypothetical protein [bacterium]